MTHRTNTRRHCPQGCTATREPCSSSCTLWEDGEKQNGFLFSLSFPGVAVRGGSPLAERQRAASSSALQLGEAHSLLPSAAQGTTVPTQGGCWPRGSSLWLWEGNRRRCWFGFSDDLGDTGEPRSFWCGGSWCPWPDSQSASLLHNPAHWSRYHLCLLLVTQWTSSVLWSCYGW